MTRFRLVQLTFTVAYAAVAWKGFWPGLDRLFQRAVEWMVL
jgi:hypothetical protein